MAKKGYRTPRNYDGTATTSHKLSSILSLVLDSVSAVHQERPDLILAAWPDVIGPQLAPMTQVVSFNNGLLIVKVKNSALLSLLSQHDKPLILSRLRQLFPNNQIHNIIFRIG